MLQPEKKGMYTASTRQWYSARIGFISRPKIADYFVSSSL